MLVGEAVRLADGGLLVITQAHTWYSLPDHGQHLARRLYEKLTDAREDLAVILAGQPGPLRDLLDASPPLAARFPVIIDFPGYTSAQPADIFVSLAGEAGFALTPAAVRKAAATLAQAHSGTGNARLAVRLLDQVIASQAQRVTTYCLSRDPAAVRAIRAVDIPGNMDYHTARPDDGWPGQYL